MGQKDFDFYKEVPVVSKDAVEDPYWKNTQTRGLLPEFYMPGSMPREHSGKTKLLTCFLIALFLSATFFGVCLTYGLY